jgi:hypothetical protein
MSPVNRVLYAQASHGEREIAAVNQLILPGSHGLTDEEPEYVCDQIEPFVLARGHQ